MPVRSVLSETAGHRSGQAAAGAAAGSVAPSAGSAAGPAVDFFGRVRIPPVLTLMLALLMLVPIELSVWVGPLRLPWYRIILVAVALPVFAQAFRLRFAAFDWCVLVHVAWMVLSVLVKRGTGGIEPGGSYLLETLVVYLMVRLAMTAPGHFTALPRRMFVVMAPVILLAIPEALILHRHLVHDIATRLTGHFIDVGYEFRLGMLRAASTFEHPILYGLFCAATISLVWVAVRGRAMAVTMVAVLCFGTVLSGSSAPLLVMLVQLAILLGERASRSVPGRFRLIVGFAVFAFVFLTVFSNRGPFIIIAQELTLSSATGYYRVLIWENGIDDVLSNPFFGIRPEEWSRLPWMSHSIDNYWLLLGMKGGFPAALLLLAALWLIWRRLYRPGAVPVEFDRLRFGWSCCALAIFLGGATVDYFGKMQPFVFLLIGFGAALAHLDFGAGTEVRRPGAQPDPDAAPAGADDGPPRRRTWL